MPNYKNPNGYGSVVKLSGNRRRPYAVRKTIDYDDRAYPIYAVIGYYETRKDAMMALAKFNAQPYDIELSKSTFAALYEAWSKQEYPNMGKSLISAHKAAYKHCAALYDKPYKAIRKFDMQACINNCGRSYATQTNIKNLFTQLDKFAFDNDIIDKCYSTNLTISEKEVKLKRTTFRDDEVKLLWKHQGEPCIDETLFMLYTGMRVTEMLTLTCDRIDLKEKVIQYGIKTAAGKNRIIPIHDKILPVIERHFGSTYLFTNSAWVDLEAEKSRYAMFVREWDKALATFGMKHTTHECRHTFRSKLDSAEANKVCIDLIMGHKSGDIGERVYTHKTLQELRTAMSKLSYGV